MSELISSSHSTAVSTFTPEQVDLIKRTIAKGANDDELKLFLYQCQRTGLDPFSRQIYFSKYRNKKTGEETVTIITGIDGYRSIAHRTGQYAGNDDPVFDDEKNPQKATVTVYKVVTGVRCPFTASARWEQYYPGDYMGFMWRKMPHLMLGKCAEALALRKAFPNEMSGVYVEEEMQQAAAPEEPKNITPPPPPPKPTYNPDFPAFKAKLRIMCLKLGIKENKEFEQISEAMRGRPSEELEAVVKDFFENGGTPSVSGNETQPGPDSQGV